MSTRERSNGRAAARGRAAGSLCLVVLVPGVAVGSAHGLASVSSQDAVPSTTPSAASVAAPVPVSVAASVAPSVAPTVSLSRWDTAVALGERPGVARPLRRVPTSPVPVPSPALSAYHRAAAVLTEAAPACELDWSLLAAVGHVESNHGQSADARLLADGVAHPAIVGPAPAAPGGHGPLPDTDGGELDGRTGQDRAVGPMQLLPSVWSAAAVDGDGDGLRDPQDVDDAALAAGVLLCTSVSEPGPGNPLRQALRRYNAAPGYVDLVDRLAAAYARTAVPPDVIAPVQASPEVLLASDARSDDPVPGPRATPTEAAGTTQPAPAPRPTTLQARSATARPAADPTASSPAVSTDPAESEQPPVESGPEPPEGPRTEVAGEQTVVTEEPATEPEPEITQASEPTSEPSPTSTSEPDPASSPSASAESTPTKSPDSPAATVTATITGVWTTDEHGRFLLDDTIVELEGLGDLTSPAPQDLDGDGLGESVRDELEGLTGATLEVVGTATGPGSVALGSPDDLRRVTSSP